MFRKGFVFPERTAGLRQRSKARRFRITKNCACSELQAVNRGKSVLRKLVNSI